MQSGSFDLDQLDGMRTINNVYRITGTMPRTQDLINHTLDAVVLMVNNKKTKLLSELDDAYNDNKSQNELVNKSNVDFKQRCNNK